MGFDYFYGQQSQQFAFYRIPRVLFTDNRFRKISTDGKVLYGLLLDRVFLSQENGWVDEEGRVYIIFTLGCDPKSNGLFRKISNQVSDRTGRVWTDRTDQAGFGKAITVYVKNFIDQENLRVMNCKNYSSPTVKVTGTDQYNLQPNNTNYNNTDLNNTNLILSEDEDRIRYGDYLSQQLDIEVLKLDYPYEVEMIDGIVDLILDVLCTRRNSIRIAGDEKPAGVVKADL